jgi:hypothetical protein
MNKKVLKLCGALSALALATVAGCGGTDDIFGTTCPASGFKLEAGTYNTTMANVTSDNCGVTAQQLMTMRSITHDTTGGMCKSTIKSMSNNELGTGAVSNNSGSFAYTATENDGVCVYDVTITSSVTVTADNTFTLAATYTEGSYRSVQGMTCTQTTGCSTVYTVTMKK